MSDKLTGIEEMREAVKLFDQCNESFNEQYCANDLINIYRAHSACEWYVYPDCWTASQVSRAAAFGAYGAPKFRGMTDEDRAMWLVGRLQRTDGLVPLNYKGEPAYVPDPATVDHSTCECCHHGEGQDSSELSARP